MAKKLTPTKAREILHDKSVHGHPLTDKQRRFFGAMSNMQNGGIAGPKTPPIKLAGTEVFEHGEDDATANKQENGVKPTDLTKKGVKYAEKVGKHAKAKGKKAVISSAIERAQQTADVISDVAGIPHQVNPVLNTWNIGEYDGAPEGSFNEKEWVKAPNAAPPGGEPFSSFAQRMEQAYDMVKQAPKSDEIITHSKVTRAFKALESTDGKWTDKTTKKFVGIKDEPTPQKDGGWLSKYDQGGLVLKQQAHDNYDKQGNYNDADAKIGPGFKGLAYNLQGRNYSPAWGGQFKQGGILQPNDIKLPSSYKVPYNQPSSELAMSIGGEQGEPAYLIPSFKYGQPLKDPIAEYQKTGEHLGGPFKTWQEADKWEEEVRHPYVEKGQSIPSPYKWWGEMQDGGNLSEKVLIHDPRESTNHMYSLKKTVTPYKTNQEIKKYTNAPTNPEDIDFLFNYRHTSGINNKNATAVPYEGEKHWNIDRFISDPAFGTDYRKLKSDDDSMEAERRNVLADMFKYQMYQHPEQSKGKSFRQAKRFVRNEIDPRVNGPYFQNYMREGVYPVNTGGITTFTNNNPFFESWQDLQGEETPANKEYRKNPWDESKIEEVAKDYLRNTKKLSRKETNEQIKKWKAESKSMIEDYLNPKPTPQTGEAPIQEMQMGGALPGATGMMYARTINPAPANGKYAKKTKASAQFGMELMPYMAQAATSISNALPSMEDIKTKAIDVIKKSPTARNIANKAVSYIANTDWGKEKLQNFARNIYPRSYTDMEGTSPVEKVYSAAIKNKKEKAREELDRDLAIPGKTFPTDSVRVDLINKYAGLPQKYGTLKPSAYTPTVGNKNEKYYSSPQIERELLEEFDRLSDDATKKKGFKTKKDLEDFIAKKVASHKEDPAHPGDFEYYTPIKGKGSNYVAPIPGLGQATYGIGEDEKGHYLSYYDNWDLNPYYGEYAPENQSVPLTSSDQLGKALLGNEKEDIATKHIGSPTKVYGRIYFDKKTGKPKMQNGGEMRFYQQGLDWTPKNISKNGSVIKDDMGQWAHPGEITEINSNDITMEGVDYPVLGVSDTGDVKLMQPDQNYKFDGKKVTEFPMAKNGWLEKYK